MSVMRGMVDYLPISVRYMIFSALGFAVMGVFVKLAYAEGIPALEIVAARALVSAVLSYLDVKRKNISLLGQRTGLLFARGVVGSITLICVYIALVSLPLAEATVLQYLHPVFTALLAIIFLRERIHLATIMCIVFSLLGLLLIVRPDFLFGTVSSGYSLWAVAAALAGAFGSGIAYVIVKKLSATEDASVIVFYFPMVALPLSLVLLGDDIVMPTGWTWGMLLMVGLATQVGQVCLTKAMRTDTASRVTSFSYLQIVFAIILGLVFFSEVPTLWTLFGALCILVGALVNILYRR